MQDTRIRESRGSGGADWGLASYCARLRGQNQIVYLEFGHAGLFRAIVGDGAHGKKVIDEDLRAAFRALMNTVRIA